MDQKKLNQVHKNPRLPSANSSEFIMKNLDNGSHVSNNGHHETPLKFRNNETPIKVSQPIKSYVISNNGVSNNP